MAAVRKSETLVARTAEALARLSLDSGEGGFLGAEDDLLARLGVSRPTLRQAAKIAENDRLISVRRGVRGGFYATRPDADDAIKTLTRYLRLKNATLLDILAVNRSITEVAVVLAARSTDVELRDRLSRFAEMIEDHDTPGALIRAETELAGLLAAMSGNPAIELFMAIGYAFGMEEQGLALYRDPGQRAEARRLQGELCRAVLAGDAEIAGVIMRRRSAAIARWIEDGMEAGR